MKRILTKNNYLIHTDAIKNYILPDNDYYKDREWLEYAEKTDILNEIAKYQLNVLNNAEQIKLLGTKIE